MLEHLKSRLIENREQILMQDEMKVNMKRMQESFKSGGDTVTGLVGSFRKLEVD